MTDYIKKSDITELINKYEKSNAKVYKDNPDIKSINITDLKSDISKLKTYKSKD